ncbi:MAG: YfiR family protein [Verrucomicrobiota bacterium]
MTSKISPHTSQRRLLRTATWRRWLALCGVIWSGTILSGWCSEPVSKEYQLKAAFLYNFTKFVEWPTNRFTTPDEPIIIGVLEGNPFGEELAKAVQDRKHEGHPLVVTNLPTILGATNVHLLFVPRGQEELFATHRVTLHAAGVLTVGESETFARGDGIITFTTEAAKIRFEINLVAAEPAGFKISSKLLQLAKVVRSPNPPGAP